MDLHIVREGWGSTSDPSLHGQLHYPYDLDGPLNETDDDKIRQYRVDYNNRPSHVIFFMSVAVSTTDYHHCELVCPLFLQSPRKLTVFFQCQFVRLV